MGGKSSREQRKKEKMLNEMGHWTFNYVHVKAVTSSRGLRGDGGEKRYDPWDTTLTFVDGNDDLDFECNEYTSLRAKMSCGHAVTPTSLTCWCQRLLEQGEYKFVCGQTNCNVEWSFEEVCKMALLTPAERDYFDKKLFNNATDLLKVKQCPECKSFVRRMDCSNLNVECTVCTALTHKRYQFCWQCLKEWKGPAPRGDHCDNDGCSNPLEILKNCEDIVFTNVKGVEGCPSIRACPSCGYLVEHNKRQCKSMVCPLCKCKFCFVCLKQMKDCLLESAYSLCPSGVAPRQTSLPLRRKN